MYYSAIFNQDGTLQVLRSHTVEYNYVENEYAITEEQYEARHLKLVDGEVVFDTEAYSAMLSDNAKAVIDAEMLAIDIKSIRSIRAYVLGEQTEDDAAFLTKHKNDIAALRVQRNNL